MRPIDFPESTKTLSKPAEMTDAECRSLPVWNDGKECISVWKAGWKERFNILLTGRVWLGVLSGNTQPPVWVDGCRPFVKASLKARISDFFKKVVEFIKRTWQSLVNAIKQPGKCKHFIAGFIISLVAGVFMPLLGVVIAMLAGAVKEWWDSRGHGTVEALDFIFTSFGALAALPFSYLVHWLLTLWL